MIVLDLKVRTKELINKRESRKPVRVGTNKNDKEDEEDFNDGNGFAWPTITSTDVM